MRFMSIVKAAENQGPPPKALMEAMGRASVDQMRSGTIVDMGGLAPSAMGARVRVKDGKLTVIDGPFSEAKEIIGGYAVLELKTKEEAVEAARWLMQLHLEHWPGWEGDCEIRLMYEDGDHP